MRKAILMMLLAVVCGSAAAEEWVQLNHGDTSTIYVNPTTMVRAGNRVKMWALFNYAVEQTKDSGDTFLSLKAQDEYHCTREQSRLLYIAQFSQHGGRGRRTFSHSYSDESDWTPVAPGSVKEILLKFACGTVKPIQKDGSASNNWELPIKVGTTVYYADRDSIRRHDDRATMWYLEDYAKPLILARSLPNESNEAWSLKLHTEYDCNETQRRNLGGVHFSENMGAGRILWSRDNPLAWERFEPGSVAHTFWEIACGKR
jgi:hypothetical protein